MLPKRYRLTNSADFRRVHAQGRSWSNRMLVLCKLSNALPNSRFGFSVSRHIGKAVVRNHTKRLLREAVRAHCDVLLPGWDVVLIARKGIVGAGCREVEESVVLLLRWGRLFRAA